MKRRFTLPLPASEVYRGLVDPILLAAWLGVPYASTGTAPLHLFEATEHRPPHPWKFRGFIVENERDRKLRIEREDLNAESWRALVISLQEKGDQTEVELAWSSPTIDSLAERLLSENGHNRLLAVIEEYPAVVARK
jgi:hypothetical protein